MTVKFTITIVEWRTTSFTGIDSFFKVIIVLAGERILCALFSQYVELFWAELSFPFLIGFFDGVFFIFTH